LKFSEKQQHFFRISRGTFLTSSADKNSYLGFLISSKDTALLQDPHRANCGVVWPKCNIATMASE
jgi:hypothetical protein